MKNGALNSYHHLATLLVNQSLLITRGAKTNFFFVKFGEERVIDSCLSVKLRTVGWEREKTNFGKVRLPLIIEVQQQ